ncbi:histidine--tRNA ligase [Terracidiphilus gabretensis]|uniref:histidine--tRNA ligase n=1 Tax=Terracidiphilus gabretensis TaxID=1577687 RepID=UPI000AF07E73|nr:histidine--tRNA ligase [Terracidiphilus gabretensis]
MSTLKAVRGTRDLLPPETALWNRIEATARRVFARYNFGEIRTPVFEDTSLFARGVGEETDIVSKEMYTWEDRERFNHQSMQKAWVSNRNYKSFKTNVWVNEKRIDLVGIFSGIPGAETIGAIEIVNFRPTAQDFELEELKNAVDSYVPDGLTALKHGFLVVPEDRNAESVEEKSFLFANVFIKELKGDFFQTAQRLTLRPENTAGVVRAYIEHKLGETGQLQKLYYIGPQFRRERPQKGRYRQFSQIGAEVIGPPSSGSESPLRDAEVLEMLATLLDELGITGWTLHINSVGSSAERASYNEVLRAALVDVAPKMCVDCQRRAVTNPLRVLDCKVPEDQPYIEALPKISDNLNEETKAHFAQVIAALDAAGVPYTRNHRLVRGLDYYTRTTFEFTHGGLGAQNALLGGGRYDGLSEAIGGPKAPGIGFAMGEDRLVLTLQSQETAQAEKMDAYIAPLGESLNAAALALARELRRANPGPALSVELGDGSFRLKKSFEAADKVARSIIILGEDELQSGILTVKNFATGTQIKVPRAELATHLRKPVSE